MNSEQNEIVMTKVSESVQDVKFQKPLEGEDAQNNKIEILLLEAKEKMEKGRFDSGRIEAMDWLEKLARIKSIPDSCSI